MPGLHWQGLRSTPPVEHPQVLRGSGLLIPPQTEVSPLTSDLEGPTPCPPAFSVFTLTKGYDEFIYTRVCEKTVTCTLAKLAHWSLLPTQIQIFGVNFSIFIY